ncbi:voltage-dependent anion channel [Schizothecium vesticola]|uniref:Voltage-dependent anion channel n=1 Tax=Schizothecium vesticola TaxID=314040 RepID=A0AA40BPN3_9PEZI|nr:voltage-dependent anion channel [Schizothecium vesticola]
MVLGGGRGWGVGGPPRAIAVLCAGLAAQGLGMLVSCFFYATYLSRLMVFGLPDKRPAMFIAVGPPSFTCSSLISMADEVPRLLPATLGTATGSPLGLPVAAATVVDVPTLAAGVWIMAVASAVFLWGLSFWFFCGAVVAVAAGMPDRRFNLSWWSFVFPNVGFVISTIRIGTALGSHGLLWFGTVMTVGLVLAWALIAWRCVRAVYKREIVWPGHDEDS